MKILILLMVLCGNAYGQTWMKIANGGDTVVASAGAVLRYGANASIYACDSGTNKAGSPSLSGWSAPVTLTASTTIAADDSIFGADPLNCVVKEIDIEETSSVQTVTVNGAVVNIPAPPASTNVCSANNVSCTNATNSDSAFIITTAGNVSLNPTETATLKAAIQALQTAQAQVVTAQAALQTVQQTIAVNHGAIVTGPYQINTDFSSTIEQIPPVPVPTAQ